MIQHVYERALQAGCFSELYIATDDSRIRDCARGFGAKVLMTSSFPASGTERVAEALSEIDFDFVVNIQGDEPLIDPALLCSVSGLLSSEKYPVVSAARMNTSYNDFLSPNIVKVVANSDLLALYFSRAAIPYGITSGNFSFFYQHVGLYGYSRESLFSFCSSPPPAIESLESLEQLRFLHLGIGIKLVLTESESIGVDTPEDIVRIEHLFKDNS